MLYLACIITIFAQAKGLSRPVGVWPLNLYTDAQDISGNDAKGQPSSPLLFTTGPNGQTDGAVSFSGGKSLLIDNQPGESLDIATAITIAAYFKKRAADEGPLFVYQGATRLTSVWSFSNNTVKFTLTKSSGGDVDLLDTGGGTDLNQWVFVTAVYEYDTTNKMKLYLDGVLVGEQDVLSAEKHSSEYPVEIGGDSFNSLYLTGDLACIQVYKTSLTIEEVQMVMNRSKDGYLCGVGVQTNGVSKMGFKKVLSNSGQASHIMQTKLVQSEVVCAMACKNLNGCMAFNFEMTAGLMERRCQLLGTMYRGTVTAKSQFDYYEATFG